MMNDSVWALLESKGFDVHTVPVTATVYDAVQKMINARIGCVMVVDQERLVGIFTERDVLVRVVGARRDPATTLVASVMTHDPTSVEPSTTLQEIADMHRDHHFRHLPVVENGRIIGMVSFRDVLRWIVRATSDDIA